MVEMATGKLCAPGIGPALIANKHPGPISKMEIAVKKRVAAHQAP
jgi:hypothetical protein